MGQRGKAIMVLLVFFCWNLGINSMSSVVPKNWEVCLFRSDFVLFSISNLSCLHFRTNISAYLRSIFLYSSHGFRHVPSELWLGYFRTFSVLHSGFLRYSVDRTASGSLSKLSHVKCSC